METVPISPTRVIDRSGVLTLALTLVLAIASYFFGQPMAIELHWFWMALGSMCMAGLSLLQFLRTKRLQRHDDELRSIMDAVPDVLFFKDTQGRYQMANAEFSRMFGLDQRAVIGKVDKDLFGSGLHERFVAQDRELIESGVARTFDEEIEVDGMRMCFESRKQPVYDRRGALCGIVGVAIDVTEQRAVKRQLEDLNARLGVALDAARMGVWEWNPASGEVRLDQRARDILDLSGTADAESDFFARLHPDDVDPLKARMRIARSGQEVGAYEFRVVDDQGAVRWIEGFMSMDRLRAGDDFVIGVNRDITERRQAEFELNAAKSEAERVLAELEQSRSDLDLALSVGGLGVWRSVTRPLGPPHVNDPAFLDAPIDADHRLREICGFGDDVAMTYRGLFALIDPQDRKRVAQRLGELYRQQGGAFRKQFRIFPEARAERIVEVRGSLSMRSDTATPGTIISFIGIVKDITDEEALKASLVTKAEEARSAVDAKAHFLAMMSHEVRTPLNGVLGMIDLVLDSPLDDDQRTMLMRCRESSVSLLTIINDVLDFSKIEARMLDIESRPLSLAGLVEDVCATFSAETARKAIGLGFHVDAAIPQFVVGDAVRLRQVLTNLIGNAVKFTDHGEVHVSAMRTPRDDLELAVRDTGIGIDPGAVETLFEPFRQADIATTRRYGGTGLGLTIVRQLVELMHGSVRCESALGVGSRFIVTLPLHPWVPSAEPAPGRSASQRIAIDAGRQPAIDRSRPEPATGQGQRVLLAEDHPINREVITRQLVKLGYACDVAEDGQQAWEMLEASGAGAGYALLLTDCHMPRLDGYELTKRLRERETAQRRPRLPIVALTANALQGEAERCLALGMDAYLSKPLQLEDLRKTLSDVLQQRQGRDGAGPASDAVDPAAPSRYAGLMQLSDGDASKVAKLVQIFVAATETDMDAMDRAAAAADHAALRQLAHRMCSACHQLDESDAVRAFRVVEHQEADDDAQLQRQTLEAYQAARQELDSVMRRAHAFVRDAAR
ncbi:ATP-binding protein [Variovorax sp. YR216]|uniref:PAS domain-containing hybrid sensor histidine kinase/response regulator n=1 Tax=Variovorax sp. YR216 TaxID=1882828 RepID=UPI00089CE0CA|nr:ATP-binding protein [Variovorax sp. YR216]SEA98374.1 PAS domain S-box-containing protein [Variovorax sp. YR216]